MASNPQRGILLGGVPGVAPAHITILGGGVVGKNAAQIAAGLRADVNILDINMDQLRYLADIMPPNVNTLFSDRHNILDQIARADLVIGAVLIEGARAPLHLLLGNVGSGWYYGSDAVRSPLDRYRGPGEPAYDAN